jgi:hypothetical protein
VFCKRFGHLGKQLVHFFAASAGKTARHVPHPLFVGEQRLRLQTDHAVVRLPMLALDVMHVVGRHHREIELLRPRDQRAVDRALLLDPVVLQFHVEIAGFKDMAILVQRGLGLVDLAFLDLVRDLALEARGEADETFRVLREDFLVDARLVVEAIEMRRRNQLNEVFVAHLVLRQQNQMIGGVAGVGGFLVEARARRDVGLATDDRLKPLLLRGLVELDGAVHVAMIGHRHRRHFARVRLVDHVRNAARPVEQAVLRVQMQMNKIRVLHQNFPTSLTPL